MKVGILGSGIVGRVLGAGFVKHGHQAMLGTRDPKKKEVSDWVRDTPGAQAGTFEETARFGDMLVLAALGRAVDEIIDVAGPANFSGKTLMDATNPLADDPPVNGILKYTTGPNESLAERIQSKLPDTRVVKAFNSVGNGLMINPQFSQGTPTMFYCGNNEQAKAEVARIIRQFGWEPYDCGTIVSARALEPLCMLWCLPGFLSNDWGHAFKMLTH
ncbi:MAG: NAD(P)-binding domain-containing protein [Bryobacterales bacterium]|nr:NAD(P)-binding domain-containing protein [Bryobacterales bacterium]MBV9401566.1 NAD(P)-binding domain-containing protein [Bryobacterales bacterium]